MRRVVSLLLALTCLLAVPATASARFSVGLGDQNPATYDLKRVDALHLQTARYVVSWDWYRDPVRVAITDQWMANVRAAGLRPLISFNRNWLPSGLHRLPTISQYLQSFALLRYRYPDVRDFGAWNEANHKTQPLAHDPRMAARYYNACAARAALQHRRRRRARRSRHAGAGSRPSSATPTTRACGGCTTTATPTAAPARRPASCGW